MQHRAARNGAPTARSWPWGSILTLVAIGAAGLAGCSSKVDDTGIRSSRWPERLSQWELYRGQPSDLEPAVGVIAYDLSVHPFRDHAATQRVLKLPPGTSAVYHPSANFDFPTGTVVALTLSYPRDLRVEGGPRTLVETRILVKQSDGWFGLPYVWNQEQTDATLEVAGQTLDVAWTGADGRARTSQHIVPNTILCKRCHENEQTAPIGLKARYLNRDFDYAGGKENQLAHWTRRGLLSGAPEAAAAPRLSDWHEQSAATLDVRARAYLEINCAHCHNPLGPARNSGLYLAAGVTESYQFGVHKTPVAAGRGSGGLRYDIVPGKPDESIMVHRMSSTEPGVAMPEFGRLTVDAEGVALIRQWIANMPVQAPQLSEPTMGPIADLADAELRQLAADALARGDPRRGEEVFHRRDLSCLKCHAVAGAGGRVGPDLAALDPVPSPAQLVESLLFPSKTIRQGYASLAVATDAGLVVTGVLVGQDDVELLLRDAMGQEVHIPRNSIEAQSPAGSLMPTDFSQRLSRGQFLDLVRFLGELAAPEVRRLAGSAAVRRWQVLTSPPPAGTASNGDGFDPSSLDRAELAWEVVYSRVNGELPLAALPAVGPGAKRLIRCHLDVTAAGKIRLLLNAAEGVVLWVGPTRMPVESETTVELPRGRVALYFDIDADRRRAPSLHVEAQAAPDAPARFQVINSD